MICKRRLQANKADLISLLLELNDPDKAGNRFSVNKLITICLSDTTTIF